MSITYKNQLEKMELKLEKKIAEKFQGSQL